MSPDSSSSNLGAPETSSKHTGLCYKPPEIVLSSTLRLCYQKGPRARERHVLRGSGRPTSPALCLLVVSSSPAHTRRIPRPHPTTSCAPTSRQLLTAWPPHQPPPTPGAHLYPELQGGLWRRYSSQARGGPSASPLNGPFQSKSHFRGEALGLFPEISSRWQCCSGNSI